MNIAPRFIEARALNRSRLLLTLRVVHCILRYGWDPRTKVIACAARVMCAKEFVIETCYIFYIIANIRFCFLMMGQVLLMSPKGGNASMDGFVKSWKCAFIICNTITL